MMMKSLPTACAHPLHDLHRQPHPVLPAAAPLVGPPVGAGRQELVDEVPLRPHHLDAVVAGLARQRPAADEVADLPLHAGGAQLPRRERGDGRLDPRRRHRDGREAVAPAVEDLQRDLAPLGVDRVGDRAVGAGAGAGGQQRAERREPALDAGGEAAGDHQADAAAGPLGEVGGQPGEVAGAVLEAGVHRPHQHAVAQGGEAEVEGGEQVRVGAGHGGSGECAAADGSRSRAWGLPEPGSRATDAHGRARREMTDHRPDLCSAGRRVRNREIRRQREEHGRKAVAVLPVHYPKELLTALDVLAVELWGPPGPPRGDDAGRVQSYVCAWSATPWPSWPAATPTRSTASSSRTPATPSSSWPRWPPTWAAGRSRPSPSSTRAAPIGPAPAASSRPSCAGWPARWSGSPGAR